MSIDIRSNGKYPSNELSNFTAHSFTFRGVECASMEGFLQSLKFNDRKKQAEVCKLVGKEAKKRGSSRNKHWKEKQKLWWNGVEYERDSKEYQLLLDEAFGELSANTNFEKALLATGNNNITHTIGHNNIRETVLTEKEFTGRLKTLRSIIQSEQNEIVEKNN